MANRHSIVIPPFPDHIDREKFAGWLSGFSDGESSFQLDVTIRKHGIRATHRFVAYFQIVLRADDTEVLRLIHSFFGCGLIRSKKMRVSQSKPQMTFFVCRTADLASIVVPHFHNYPLYAKKRRDFEIWSQGVAMLHEINQRPWIPHNNGWRCGFAPKWTKSECDHFAELARALREQRRYEAPASVVPEVRSRDAQLILF